MLPQLRVLAILFTALILIFLVTRKLLIPDSFGQYGNYRGNALIDNQNHETRYAGKQVCINCHSDIFELLQQDMHQGLSCETCHGPGLKHADSMEPADIMKMSSRDDCGRCHGYNPARLGKVAMVDINTHNIETGKCINCHNPHQVWMINQ